MEHGADLDMANDHGNTALHYTSFWGFEYCTLFLLENGASRNLDNRYGKSAMSRASDELKKAVSKIDSNADSQSTEDLSASRKITRTGTAVGRGRTRKGRTLVEAQIENKLRFLSKSIH